MAMEIILKGSGRSRNISLTIDDFPSSGLADSKGGSIALLDSLQELEVPTTFFCIGERVDSNPGVVAHALQAGHEVGNHMARDQWSILLSKEKFIEQLDYTAKAIQKDLITFGLPPISLRWFRPSGGWPTPSMIEWASDRGYRTVLGSIWPFDGLSIPLIDPKVRLGLQQQFVERFAHPGGIIVMHDTIEFNPLTRETLKEVVPRLRQEGYTFVGLSELLAE